MSNELMKLDDKQVAAMGEYAGQGADGIETTERPEIILCQANHPEVTDSQVARAGEFYAKAYNENLGTRFQGIIIAALRKYVCWWPREPEGKNAEEMAILTEWLKRNGRERDIELQPMIVFQGKEKDLTAAERELCQWRKRRNGDNFCVATETYSFLVVPFVDGKAVCERPATVNMARSSAATGKAVMGALRSFVGIPERAPVFGVTFNFSSEKRNEPNIHSVWKAVQAGPTPIEELAKLHMTAKLLASQLGSAPTTAAE